MTSITLLNQSECGKRIKAIARIGARLQTEIHIVAVSTLAHIRDHSDYTLAVRLLDALPSGQRVKALAVWFGHFSGSAATFTLIKGEGWKCTLLKKRTPEMFDIEGAAKTTFADLTEEKSPTTMTVKQVIAMLKKNADSTAVNADGTPRISEDAKQLFAELFGKATTILADIDAENVKRAKAAARAKPVAPTTPETDPVELQDAA